MRCKTVEKYLAAYVDDEIPPGWVRRAIEDHLMRCPLCRKVLLAQKSIKNLLTALHKVKAPPDLENRIKENIFR